ncbi:MAG: hypothetical protein GF364_22050 [Candidatus Lokiarchaeota archaeon]|nr:hypothetical protein [Candidatus Lokiarchaeota archaeon]
MGKSKNYNNADLIESEYIAMKDLESVVGEPIPLVQTINWEIFGFVASDNHVTRLGLYNRGLNALPDTICSLSSLKGLWLGDNNLNTLPEQIGDLKSLKILNLSGNNLKVFPDSILSLISLEQVWLGGIKISSLPNIAKKWLKQLRNNGCTIYK